MSKPEKKETNSPVPVKTLIDDINKNLKQKSASRNDELAVMQSMLSDPTFEVNVWGKDKIKGTYNPCKDYRSMGENLLVNTTRISHHEANTLMEGYVPSKKECESMVNLSKEFINTYLTTERKIALGGRDDFDASLQVRHVEAAKRTYPSKDDKGNTVRVTREVPAHDVVKIKNRVRKEN